MARKKSEIIETHYACVNTVICNKYGFQPSKICQENACRYVVKFDAAAQEELCRSNKNYETQPKRFKRKSLNNTLHY